MFGTKRWRRSKFSLGLASWLIAAYAKLIWVTGRWTIEGHEHLLRLDEQGGPILAAFWHGRILVMPFARPRRAKFHMVISAHDDGRIIAGAVSYFGIEWIAGSSSEGGSAALRAMLRLLKTGNGVGITPDGPDGPAMVAKPGIAHGGAIAVVAVTVADPLQRPSNMSNPGMPMGGQVGCGLISAPGVVGENDIGFAMAWFVVNQDDRNTPVEGSHNKLWIQVWPGQDKPVYPALFDHSQVFRAVAIETG